MKWLMTFILLISQSLVFAQDDGSYSRSCYDLNKEYEFKMDVDQVKKTVRFSINDLESKRDIFIYDMTSEKLKDYAIEMMNSPEKKAHLKNVNQISGEIKSLVLSSTSLSSGKLYTIDAEGIIFDHCF